MAEKLVAFAKLDQYMADRANLGSSQFRAALQGLLPQSSATPSASVAQIVQQRADGTFPNPVRDANVAGRIWVATVNGALLPGYADGLRTGDIAVTAAGWRAATNAPATSPATWVNIAGGTPTDPGTPGTPGDTSTPSSTSRPFALLGSTGQWASPTGVTLVQALSDGAGTAVTGTPIAGQSNGVSLTLDMLNFSHTTGNTLSVTLVGAAATTPGDVTVTLGSGSQTYASPLTRQVTGTAGTLVFTWAPDAQLALPASSWRDVEVTVARAQGGLTIADVVLQSLPPVVTPPAGTDPTDAASIKWASNAVWYSDLTSAPLAKANTAVAAYVKAQAGTGTVRLDCYADAAPIWMVPGSTPRVNVTVPTTSPRGSVALLTNVFASVPLPASMPAPANTFQTAVIVCPETSEMWEFLGLTKTGSTWSATWGGKISNYPTSGGVHAAGLGYTGSGLAWAAPAVKVSEAKDAAAGNVNAIGHAIGINLNYDTANTAYTWPATRSDGTSSDAGAPKMGQRIRLKANADLSACTPLGKAIGTAMKRYGAVIMGGAERISILAQSGATDQASTGVDPWGAILAGKTVDTVLAGLPLDQLEAVSPGWGGPNWTAEPDVVTPPPTDPNPPTTPGTNRRPLYIPPDAKWVSGASCRAIEGQADGMASTFASWRGEPCYFARTWSDNDGGKNDPQIWTLLNLYKNWHSSIDVGIGMIGYRSTGETLSAAASGAYDSRWTATFRTARGWWQSRRDPSKVACIISPAHEMNGNWYNWSVNSGNYTTFITAWKRMRVIQLREFPESLLCFNANAQSIGANMDWRKMVPGYAEGKVKDFVDIGGVDYYNYTSSLDNAAAWQTHINRVDQWGGPWGLEKHRQFWEQCGLPLTIPEWSNHKGDAGDKPLFAQYMCDYMRQWAGTGPGRIYGDALFNLSTGYEAGLYAVYGDTVGSPNFAANYKNQNWGR